MFTYIVIDDESLIRKGIIKKLNPITDKVICIGEAANGQEALQLLTTMDPDIIITDMNMPVMDGGQLLPILAERYPQKYIIIISGYKDFEYTRHAIRANAVDYLLKPFSREDLIASVESALKLIEDSTVINNRILSSEAEKEIACYEYDIQMLKNSILGYHTSKISLTAQKLMFVNTTHNLILITLHSKEQIQDDMLQNFLQRNGFGDLALYLQHIHNQNLGFLVLFIPQNSVLTEKDLCLQVIRSLNNLFSSHNMKVSYGVSNVHHSLTRLHEAFIETVKALNLMSVNVEEDCFFFHSELPEPLNIEWDRSEELMFRIEAGMKKQVSELLDSLFHYFSELPECTLYDAKCYCFRLADTAKTIMAQYFEQIDANSVSVSVQNILNTMFSLDEIKQYYLQFFINMAQILISDSIYATDDTIEKIKTYVTRNYQKPLTLEFISSLFYMNRSYCSHLFKEQTGDNFVNYVNSIRIDKAKQLLIKSDKKMYQISKAVGYDNVKYFFRIFKKCVGVTPEQYRLSIIKK